ncbi:MAG: hypothetical protein ACQESG_01485 [Nanobdellota archaeon]
MTDTQRRQVAYKVRIQDILDGEFIKQEGWNPSYIQNNGREISRVNIIATIVTVDENQLLVDDGSGRITLRIFENQDLFSGIDIGDSILIIGKVREFNDRYIIPEIIKRISDARWIEVRKKELEKQPKIPNQAPAQKERTTKEEDLSIAAESQESEARPADTETQESEATPTDAIYNLIKKADTGDGADIDDIIESSNNPNAEKIINNLLVEGEIFEISPGKIKVLE